MAKVALLIGVGEYGAGLNALPGAIKDVEAMQRVLQHSEMGQFDQVKTLANPDPLVMQGEIENLCADRSKDDLILLFFSGHGVKDDSNRLYLATTITRKTAQGELVKSTAVPAHFVNDVMLNSRSKRQVVLLDCCFSGAFAEDMRAKDDGSIDVQTQLGGEGRAVLTSSSSTQYSFEQQGSDLSIYTRFLVEGLETGAADLNGDGIISIDELHEYASRKVQESAPAMKPKIYAVEEGFKIRLAKAPVGDPKLRYRQEVESFASRGEISDIARYTLNTRQNQLGLSTAEAQEIEAQVLKPYQEYKQKLQQYEEALVKELERENPLPDYKRQELKRFQEVLGLESMDIESIRAKLRLPNEEVQSRIFHSRAVRRSVLLGSTALSVLIGVTMMLPRLLELPTSQQTPQIPSEITASSVFKVSGETCPPGSTLVTYEEAIGYKNSLIQKLGEWDIARLAGGGSMTGSGYSYEIRRNNDSPLGHALCKEL
ncbi:caspase family protein [Pseudanabaena sp. FACHB-2040]|uniref:caspase family protein n=1 Tax=Pseudanabaena sp. FACHB-2040 TaxID=2692859 RepID=UPI0032203ED7